MMSRFEVGDRVRSGSMNGGVVGIAMTPFSTFLDELSLIRVRWEDGSEGWCTNQSLVLVSADV